MDWVPLVLVIGLPILLLVFVAVFGPNKVRGRKWRGWRQPSAMMGPDRPEPPDARRS
jgi:hypothetical protein